MNYEGFQWVNQWAGHFVWLDRLMVFITNNAMYLYALALLVMWFWPAASATLLEKRRRLVLLAGITGVLALVVNAVIGVFYYHPRPFITHQVTLLTPHANDSSFPSDHTTGAFAISFAVLAATRRWGLPLLVLAIATGFSRIFVGVHYPLDILGSITVALITFGIVKRYHNVLERPIAWVLRTYNRLLGKQGAAA